MTTAIAKRPLFAPSVEDLVTEAAKVAAAASRVVLRPSDLLIAAYNQNNRFWIPNSVFSGFGALSLQRAEERNSRFMHSLSKAECMTTLFNLKMHVDLATVFKTAAVIVNNYRQQCAAQASPEMVSFAEVRPTLIVALCVSITSMRETLRDIRPDLADNMRKALLEAAPAYIAELIAEFLNHQTVKSRASAANRTSPIVAPSNAGTKSTDRTGFADDATASSVTAEIAVPSEDAEDNPEYATMTNRELLFKILEWQDYFDSIDVSDELSLGLERALQELQDLRQRLDNLEAHLCPEIENADTVPPIE